MLSLVWFGLVCLGEDIGDFLVAAKRVRTSFSSSSSQILRPLGGKKERNKHMGQVLGSIQDKLRGTDWKERQLRKITDRVFDRFKDEAANGTLTFDDLYIAVLFVYNDLNKHLPGPHFDPPTKAQVKAMMEMYDLNLDGELDREEFAGFIQKMTSETLAVVSQGLIIALVAAPTVALMTKRATEGVPGVGKVVEKLPNSVYASLVTLAIVLLQNVGKDIE